MELQLVDYEQAKALKAAGFDWETVTAFLDDHGIPKAISGGLQNWNMHNDILFSRPTVALSLLWILEKGLRVSTEHTNFNFETWVSYIYIKSIEHPIKIDNNGIDFTTLFLAESEGLSYALKILSYGLDSVLDGLNTIKPYDSSAN